MNQSNLANPSVSIVERHFRHGLIGFYMMAAFLYWISLYLYVPTLPTYVQTKTENLAQMGAILSMYGLWQGVIRLPLGILVDWLGRRKPFIIAGLVLAGMGAWSMGRANGPGGLFIGRSITGLAAAAWVPLLVAFSGLFPVNEAVRATALLTFANTSGRILATSATGALNNIGGFTLPFLLASGVAGLAILFILPTPEEVRPRLQPSMRGIARLVTRRDVLLPSLLAAVSQYANWATTFGFTPILAGQLGGSDVTQSMLVTVNLLVVILTNLFAARLARHFGARPLILFSFWMLVAGMGITTMATSLPMLFAAQLFIGISQGINFPVLMGLSIRFVAESGRNTAMGLHQSVYAAGMFAGPWVSGILAQAVGLRPMLFISTLGILVLGWMGGSRLDQDSHG